eukprot:947900-Rhodomonas_salina.1
MSDSTQLPIDLGRSFLVREYKHVRTPTRESYLVAVPFYHIYEVFRVTQRYIGTITGKGRCAR